MRGCRQRKSWQYWEWENRIMWGWDNVRTVKWRAGKMRQWDEGILGGYPILIKKCYSLYVWGVYNSFHTSRWRHLRSRKFSIHTTSIESCSPSQQTSWSPGDSCSLSSLPNSPQTSPLCHHLRLSPLSLLPPLRLLSSDRAILTPEMWDCPWRVCFSIWWHLPRSSNRNQHVIKENIYLYWEGLGGIRTPASSTCSGLGGRQHQQLSYLGHLDVQYL